VETRRLALLLHGARDRHYSEAPRGADFYDGSGAVAAAFAGLGAPPPSFTAADLPFLAKGRAARVLSAEGKDAGWVGVLAAPLGAEYDLTDAVVADVDLMAIEPRPVPTSLEAPFRFPGSEIDLTVTHRVAVPFRTLREAVLDGAPAELLAVTARSRYAGEKVPEGFVKTTLNLRFGSAERSLAREDVNAWQNAAAARLLALPETRVDGYEGVPA
jgi:phenylalanyl-tRNA synthetase beta subunit